MNIKGKLSKRMTAKGKKKSKGKGKKITKEGRRQLPVLGCQTHGTQDHLPLYHCLN